MTFKIQKRAPRGQALTVGIRNAQHREALAKAIEAASLINYNAYAATMTNTTQFVGFTPAVGAIPDRLYVTLGGTGTGTVDIFVNGVTILAAPYDLNGKSADTPYEVTNFIAGALLTLTAGKAVKFSLTTGTATAVGLDFHCKSVDNRA